MRARDLTERRRRMIVATEEFLNRHLKARGSEGEADIAQEFAEIGRMAGRRQSAACSW